MNRPTFFLIGAPKCGTTAMAQYLFEHPQVCFSDPKEPYFWARDFPGIQHHLGVRSLEEYLRLFETKSENCVAFGEGSTIYLASSTAVANIIEFQPAAKFIVMLRHPVDLAASLHAQQLSCMNEDCESFETAWRLQGNRRRGKDIPYRCYESALLQYKQIASLGQQVTRLLKIVPRDRVQLIFFDDFNASVLETYLKTLEFLGLRYDSRTEFPRVNEGKRPRIKWLTRMLTGRRGTAVSRFLKRKLKGRLLTFANGTKKVLTRRASVRPPLSPQFRNELLNEFRDDIRSLADCTGCDLSNWFN